MKENVTEPSSGDYIFNQRLNEHAAQQAGKRWRKLDQEYRNKQLEAYGYTNVVESQAPDYEQYQKVYEFADKLAGEIFIQSFTEILKINLPQQKTIGDCTECE